MLHGVTQDERGQVEEPGVQSLRNLTQKEGVHVHEMPNVGVVWEKCERAVASMQCCRLTGFAAARLQGRLVSRRTRSRRSTSR